ncbi:rCG41558, partial [Rattus norvegicus]
MDACIELSGA